MFNSNREHLKKHQMVAIVQENFGLWPKELKWDTNPLEQNQKPTTKTLIKVIMKKYNDVDEHAPDVDEQQLDVDEQDSNVEEHAPNVDEQQPDVGKQDSNIKEQEPNVEEHAPNVDEQQSDIYEQDSNVDEHTPKMDVDEEDSDVDEHMPDVDEQQPDVGKQDSNVEEQEPNVEEHAPNVDEQQSDIYKQDSNVDEHEHNLSPVAGEIWVLTQADPALMASLRTFLSSKNHKKNDASTIASYKFAIKFNESWYGKAIEVNVLNIFSSCRRDVVFTSYCRDCRPQFSEPTYWIF